MSKILVSGVKPTGRPHIGNYFGAMKQFVDLQKEYKCFIFIANLHALTSIQNAEEMRRNSRDVAIDYLAIGIDPDKTELYLQSDVPHLAEVAWVFECMTTMPYLMRAHAFKDAEAKNKDINVGTFNYPLLMAADILMMDADVVPVGQDQKQHIEITRDIAEKFNRTFGPYKAPGSNDSIEIFKLPEALILDDVATVPGIDGQKMSKSYNNTIPLFAEDEEIEKLVMSIVTDSSGERPENVYAIHALVRDKESLDRLYEEKKGKYKDLKEALIEDLKAFIGPLREKREEWAAQPEKVEEILSLHGQGVRRLMHWKLMQMRDLTGLIHHE